MIYFNIQQPQAQAQPTDNHHLALVRRNLAIALDKNSRLTMIAAEAGRTLDAMSADLQAAQQVAIEAGQRIAELTAERDELIAENVRLTGQVHALLDQLAVAEQAARAAQL